MSSPARSPRRRLLLAAGLGLACGLLVACQATPDAATDETEVSTGVVNDRCPITKEPLEDVATTLDLRGVGTVGFSSGASAGRFAAMSEDEKRAAVDAAID